MTIKEEINGFYNDIKLDKKGRELGKYWATDFWKIHKGYLTIPEYIKQMDKDYAKPIDKRGQKCISMGEMAEAWLCKVLKARNVEFEDQHRLELKIDDIIISGKTDFYFTDKIIETKFPDIEIYEVPEKYSMQMEFYYRASGKPVYLGIFYKTGDEIIRFFPYIPNDKLWNTMQKDVIDFDNRLRKKLGKVEKNININK